jgi:uncharacterized membrane protein
MFAKNMGTIDRAGRTVIALILLYLALGTSVIGSGVLMWLAIIVAAVFLVTSVVGNCPLYKIVGLKTCSDC